MSLDVAATLAGREILLTGTTGFLGKVFLVMLLEKCPDIARIHVVIRPNADGDAALRFERIANESPAFAPLHDRHGAGLSAFLRAKVSTHDGDLRSPCLGLDPAMFGGRLALVVNCAAVVDFDPDVRAAFTTNTHGPTHAAELARACGAGLVQVSTCYVAGKRDGKIGEHRLSSLPNDGSFDAAAEFAALDAAIEELAAHHESDAFSSALEAAAIEYLETRGKQTTDPDVVHRQAERMRIRRMADDWVALGLERAAEHGWPNTYTYTKGIAEGLLGAQFADVPHAIVRPAVVESAIAFPFAGWNEGFNTCGPLAYLIGTWFKAFPGRRENPFDVVPVDMVSQALGIASAAVIAGEQHDIYQVASSERNRLSIGRAAELSGLGQRRWLRKHGDTVVDRVIKSRVDTTVFQDGHPLSLENVDRAMKGAAQGLRKMPVRAPSALRSAAENNAFIVERSRRAVRRLQLMVNAFTPFTRDLRQSFVADNLSNHGTTGDFVWNPESIDWRDYWLGTHMPGMRKWSFPLFERRDPPKLESEHVVDLNASSEAAE